MEIDRKSIGETVSKIEHSVNERWNRGDVDGALEAYADDVTYFDPLTETRLDGKKAVESYFRRFFEGKLNILRNDFLHEQVIVSDHGDMAVITYNLINLILDENGKEKEGTKWNSTQVYKILNGEWRVVHVNWSFTRHPSALQGIMS